MTLPQYDLGILRLNTSIVLASVGLAKLVETLPAAGTAVSMVGYGGPQFFTLGATVGTRVIESSEVVSNQDRPNTKIIFMHDLRDQITANQTQAGAFLSPPSNSLTSSSRAWRRGRPHR